MSVDKEVFAVPVKYMVVANGDTYNIIDTSFEGNGKVVWSDLFYLSMAHSVCKTLNNGEGFQYAY